MNYEQHDTVAVITLDDNKANVMNPEFFEAINENLDRANKDAKAVILRGRDGVFSAGFDLKVFKLGKEATNTLVRTGFELLIRLYGSALPVVAACSGHSIGMGGFVLLTTDTRIGVEGDYRINLPETAISMNFSPFLVAIAEARLAPPFITRAAIHAEVFGPDVGLTAGFLDEVVAVANLDNRAMEVAEQLATLPEKYYRENKMHVRSQTLERMKTTLQATLPV